MELPAAFLQAMERLLGPEYPVFLQSYQQPPRRGLRRNPLKCGQPQLEAALPFALEPTAFSPLSYAFAAGEEGVGRLPAHHAGLFYVQEPSACSAVTVLDPQPGEKVLDLCAAPGGKSTQIAGLLAGEGLLWSNEIVKSRAQALLSNVERLGVPNAVVSSCHPQRLCQSLQGFFDKVLVDAPCSGEGMFRRDEDMVKDWNEKGPEYYVPIQRQILSQAAAMLRPGGYMLYSTCTFSVEEDEGNVAYVLEEFPQMQLCCLDLDKVPGACGGFGLPGCMRLFPHRLKGEGHFLALMRKKGGDDGGKEILPPMDPGTARKRVRAVEKEKELDAFLRQSGAEWDYGRIVIHQDNVYYLPEGLAWNLPLRFLRTGLFLGELKKGRFEPSQALAMSMKAGQFPNTVSFPAGDNRVLRYLKGETISLEGDEGPVKGWCLAAMEGFPLGWAKGTGMSLKNKYYPGWRWQ